MKCIKCGTENEDKFLFCINCGTMLESPSATAPSQAEPVSPGTATDAPGKNKNVFLIGGLAAAAVLLVMVIGIVMMGQNGSRDRELAGKMETETAAAEEAVAVSGDKEGPDAGNVSGEYNALTEKQTVADEIPGLPEPAATRPAADIPAYDSTPDSEYILKDSSSRYLAKSDLWGLDEEACRLARNEIYARHGRKFDDEGLQNYFNSCSWYYGIIKPADFQETMLSEIEIANRDLIVEYEKEMGYR